MTKSKNGGKLYSSRCSSNSHISTQPHPPHPHPAPHPHPHPCTPTHQIQWKPGQGAPVAPPHTWSSDHRPQSPPAPTRWPRLRSKTKNHRVKGIDMEGLFGIWKVSFQEKPKQEPTGCWGPSKLTHTHHARSIEQVYRDMSNKPCSDQYKRPSHGSRKEG